MDGTHRRPLVPIALLVDRDVDTRQMYAQSLRLANFEVEEASEGREALAKALTSHYDVVVTDTRLPGIDGYDLCSLLRRDPATQTLPIVVVTGEAHPADLRRAHQAGANVVLVKPCLHETLLAAIHRVMEPIDALPPDIGGEVGRAAGPLAPRAGGRLTKSRAHQRGHTAAPPSAPPALVCPGCDQLLVYERSYVGGVSANHAEQWDLFECRSGCGTFQYRQRTRRLRRV